MSPVLPGDASDAVSDSNPDRLRPDSTISISRLLASWRATPRLSRAIAKGLGVIVFFIIVNIVKDAAHKSSPDLGTHTKLSNTVSPVAKESELLKQPVFTALREREPQAYETVEHAVRVSIDGGSTILSQSKMNAQITRVFLQVLKRYLPFANDDVLFAYVRYILAQETALQRVSADLCFGYEFPDTLPGKQKKYYGSIPEWESLADILTQALLTGDKSRTIPSDADAAKVYAHLERSLGPKAPLLTDMNDATKRAAMNKQDGCRILIAFYRATLQLPRQEAGNFMRYLMFHAKWQ